MGSPTALSAPVSVGKITVLTWQRSDAYDAIVGMSFRADSPAAYTKPRPAGGYRRSPRKEVVSAS